MNRVCLTKMGKFVSMQSGGKVNRLPREHVSFKNAADYTEYLADCDFLEAGRLNTLKQNALNAGYKEDEIDVKWVTDEEWLFIQEANKPIPTYRDKRIQALPSIGDQLDMQYWDSVNGTTIWKDMITKLKNDIPKE